MSAVYAGMPLRLRCPKCRSGNYELHEHYTAHVIYCVKNGVLPEQADDRDVEGTTAVTATCSKCGHWWRARGATSLTDVVIEAQAGETGGDA